MSALLWNPKVSNLGFTKENIAQRKEQLLGRALLERELRDQITDTRLGEQLELERRRMDFEPIAEGVQQLTEVFALKVTPKKLAEQYRNLIQKAARPGAKGPSLQETLQAVVEDMKNRIANNDLAPEDVTQVLAGIEEIKESAGNWRYSHADGFALDADTGLIYAGGDGSKSKTALYRAEQHGIVYRILRPNGDIIYTTGKAPLMFEAGDMNQLFRDKPYSNSMPGITTTGINNYNWMVDQTYGNRRGRFLLDMPANPAEPVAPPAEAGIAQPVQVPPREEIDIGTAKDVLQEQFGQVFTPIQLAGWATALQFAISNPAPNKKERSTLNRLIKNASNASNDMDPDSVRVLTAFVRSAVEQGQEPIEEESEPKAAQQPESGAEEDIEAIIRGDVSPPPEEAEEGQPPDYAALNFKLGENVGNPGIFEGELVKYSPYWRPTVDPRAKKIEKFEYEHTAEEIEALLPAGVPAKTITGNKRIAKAQLDNYISIPTNIPGTKARWSEGAITAAGNSFDATVGETYTDAAIKMILTKLPVSSKKTNLPGTYRALLNNIASDAKIIPAISDAIQFIRENKALSEYGLENIKSNLRVFMGDLASKGVVNEERAKYAERYSTNANSDFGKGMLTSIPVGEGRRRKAKKPLGGQKGGAPIFNEISRQLDGMKISKAQKMAVLRAARQAF